MLKHIPFYSSLVKRNLFDNVNSTQTDVLLYGAIEAHSMGHLGCIASNDLISREIGVSVGTVANGLSKLNKAGWVRVNMDDNNHRISIEPLLELSTPLHSSVNPPSRQNEPPLHSSVNIEHSNRIHLDKSNVKTAKQPNDKALKISKSLNQQLKSRYDYIDTSDKTIASWAFDIEKINRIDGVDYSIIEKVMNWSQKDDFWESNIKSGKTLRKQMTTLRMRIDKDKNKPGLNKSYTNMKTFTAPKDNRSSSVDSEAFKKYKEARNKLLKNK